MNILSLLKPAGYLFLVSLFVSSCIGSKPVAYFNQGKIDTNAIQNIRIPDQVIQNGDLLSITVFSDNPEATAIFNQASGAQVAPSSTVGVSRALNTAQSSTGGGTGYLVDNNGNIRMHALGEIKAEGLTKNQLSDLITSKLNTLGVLNNPYCIVRFNIFKVTILGEVRSPGVFTLPAEKASILEAVGLAGDITDYGLKDRVLLIREDQGKRTFHRVNLLDPTIFSSPYFYLRQNDVIIIEPDTRKPTAFDQQTLQYVMIGATLASTAAILITLFK